MHCVAHRCAQCCKKVAGPLNRVRLDFKLARCKVRAPREKRRRAGCKSEALIIQCSGNAVAVRRYDWDYGQPTWLRTIEIGLKTGVVEYGAWYASASVHE